MRLRTPILALVLLGGGCDPASGVLWLPPEDDTDLLRRVVEGRVEVRDHPFLEALVARLEEGPGPWHHDVYVATSDDLERWQMGEAPILHHCSTPDLAAHPEGGFLLACVDGDLDAFLEAAKANDPVFRRRGLVGIGGLGLHRWVPGSAPEPLEGFGIGGLSSDFAVDPDLVLREDGAWSLLHVAFDLDDLAAGGGDATADYPRRGVLSGAADAVDWTEHAVIVEDRTFVDPTHFQQGDTWHVLWTGLEELRSADGGAHWDEGGDPGLVGRMPDVVSDGAGGWLVTFAEAGDRVALARSEDGSAWVDPEVLSVPPATHPSLAWADGTWFLAMAVDGNVAAP